MPELYVPRFLRGPKAPADANAISMPCMYPDSNSALHNIHHRKKHHRPQISMSTPMSMLAIMSSSIFGLRKVGRPLRSDFFLSA